MKTKKIVPLRSMVPAEFVVIFNVLLTGVALTWFTPAAFAGDPVGVCVDPRGCTPSSGSGSGNYSGPVGPSPEQQRRMRDAKDSREAADDASDKGVDAYNKGNFESAAKWFREALEYAPDDQDIRANLGKAEQKVRAAREARERQALEAARQTEAARQLNSAAQHSQAAMPTANTTEAQRGFDTAGRPAGGLPGAVYGAGAAGSREPVIPASKRTAAITALETQRNQSKQLVKILDDKLKKLEPGKDTVEIAKVKQEKNTADSKVQFLNFSIGEMLDKPSQTSQPSTR